jgi:integrase
MKRIPHFHEKHGQGKNGKRWNAYYHVAKIDGKVKWTALGTDRVEALRKWADLEKCPVPPETGTFNAVADLYMQWLEEEAKTGRNSRRTYDDRMGYLKTQLRPVFGAKPFEAITSLTVRTYLDKRTAKISAKKEMRFLSVLWNWAKERGHVKLANPVAGVRMPKESGRDIEVQPHEYWLVWECGDQMVKDVLELAARLGTRPQEVFDLKWKDVDLRGETAIVRVWQNKVSGWRTVEADDGLRAVLERLRGVREQPQGYVLTDAKGAQLRTTGAFRYRFDKARNMAELEAKKRGVEIQRFQHRDIRPMAGISTLQSEGMDAARRLLGHTTERMTADYTTKRIGMVGKSAPVRSTSNSLSNTTE